MKILPTLVLPTLLALGGAIVLSADERVPQNPDIDYRTFLQEAARLEKVREARRISEMEFIWMASERDTIVLDARSTESFRQVHVKGAVNLSLPDFNAASLARLIPSKSTRILIYCNNNFRGGPAPLVSKAPSASLNISTFNALHSYGYTNVFELGPLLPYGRQKLVLEGDFVR